jgi:hypothetical protein
MKYNTSLQARFYDAAERLYVEDGLSPRAVSLRLKKEHGDEAPSRRTIYNWADDGSWDAARRKWHQAGQDIQEGLIDAIRMAVKNAIANPGRDTFSALKNAMKSAEMFHQLRAMEQAVTELEADGDEADPEEVEEAAYEIVRDAIEG